jgi:hypothetical protein
MVGMTQHIARSFVFATQFYYPFFGEGSWLAKKM